MNEKKTNASIHAETPDGQNFTVQIEGTGGGIMGCLANMIHSLAESMGVPREILLMKLAMELESRTFEQR